MTESMASLEELVQRGSREGVGVNVVTRFSADAVADLVAQVEAMTPNVVILGARDAVAPQVQAHASSEVVITGDRWELGLPAAVVHATWGGTADDDAAVVLAVRLASSRAIPLNVELEPGGSQRRLDALVARLKSNGVVLAEEIDENEPRWRVGSLALADVDLGVRAEPDPEPVDWALVRPSQPRTTMATPPPSGG
jgi:hypothetical protein